MNTGNLMASILVNDIKVREIILDYPVGPNVTTWVTTFKRKAAVSEIYENRIDKRFRVRWTSPTTADF